MKYLSLKKMLIDSGISMPEHQIKAYTNVFTYLEHITEHKYSEQQLFDLYIDLGNIAEGKSPRTATIAYDDETVPGLIKIMDEIPLIKGKLSMEQKSRIAFCVSAVTGVRKQPVYMVFDCFKSIETAEDFFDFLRKAMPSWFEVNEK